MGVCCGGAKDGKVKYDKAALPIKKGPAAATTGGVDKKNKTVSPAVKSVKIFGDYFSSEMRAILTALDYADIKYDFEHVDSLREE